MPSITVTVTAEQATRAMAAIRARYPGSPLNDAQLAQQFLRDFLKGIVLEYERQQAEKAISVTEF